MKKYKSLWFYLTFALTVSLTIIIINILNETAIPKIVQDINSGVIGAILTTIITLILLSNQSEREEKVTKNSVVYEEKLKIYNNFLDIIGKALEDGKLSADEIQKIIHGFSTLRIHLSAENSIKIEEAVRSINNEFFFVDENGIQDLDKYISLYTNLTNVFRSELYNLSSANQLPNFNFSNLKAIAFKPRNISILINSFDDLIKEFGSHKKLIYIQEGAPTVVFNISKDLIDTFKTTFFELSELIKNYPKPIQIEYSLTKYYINDTTYLGLPFIKFYYSKQYIICYGISEKNRIYLKRKIPKDISIFTIEPFEDQSNLLDIHKRNILKIINEITETIDSKTNN